MQEFELHDRVTHDKYGMGQVVGIEPGGALLVDFGTQKVKILSPYVKLHKL
ncbi:hypothetical protein AB0J52_20860 [Spirillospora sp. NPDC049652]